MGNFTLNLYKAFGIKKARRPSYSVQLHDFVYDKDENPIEEGYGTRDFSPSSGGRTHKVSNARKAMHHAINHVRNTNSPANIYTSTGGDAILYAHPKTGLLTLRHVQHSDDEKDVFKTAFELNQNWIIELSGDRTPFISQAQSVNLFFVAPRIQ